MSTQNTHGRQALIRGTRGDDSLTGTDGDDFIRGRRGNDTMLGFAGIDTLLGDDGNDNINGGDGNDRILGGRGNDTLLGLQGNDTVFGGAGRDLLVGAAGNDVLQGDDGNDTIDAFFSGDFSGRGHDVFIPGRGDDLVEDIASRGLDLNDPGDVFVYQRDDGRHGGGFGNDTAIGFNTGNDQLVFSGYGPNDLTAPVAVAGVANPDGTFTWNAAFHFDDGSALQLSGVSAGAPTLRVGSEYVFSDDRWLRRAARNDWQGIFRD